MGGFTEGGLKLQSSVASYMVSMMPAAAPAGPYVVAIMGATAFVAQVVGWISDDDSAEFMNAVEELHKAIDHMTFLINTLRARINEMEHEAAIEANRNTLRALEDYLGRVKTVQSKLRNLPVDAGTSVAIADEAGIIVDSFLRDDYEIWRWSDVVVRTSYNPQTGAREEHPDHAPLMFKNLPTLPVYQLAVLTWLAARERARNLGGRDRLDGDAERVQQHLNALTVRPEFRKYPISLVRYPDGTIIQPPGTVEWIPNPATLPEHIKARIRSTINANTRYPENRRCSFWFDVQNWMSGEEKHANYFDIYVTGDYDEEGNPVFCYADPKLVAPPAAEDEAEEAAGTAALEELRATLARVAQSGTVRKPWVGQFPDWTASKSNYYGVNAPGQLLWFQHLWTSEQPDGPAGLSGPRSLANGWNEYKFVLPAGDKGIYVVKQDGTLLWHKHEGAFDGNGPLSAPTVVGHGWAGFATIVAGGNGVLYAMNPDGTLWWYKHDGFLSGGSVDTWRGPFQVGTGWNAFKTIFASGDGIVYGVKPDGALLWCKHNGVDDGTMVWEPPIEVGSGWQDYTHIFGVGDGVIYAKQANGPLLWHRHTSWETAVDYQVLREFIPELGRVVETTTVNRFPLWEGPVPVGDDTSRYLYMFGVLPKPFRGPR